MQHFTYGALFLFCSLLFSSSAVALNNHTHQAQEETHMTHHHHSDGALTLNQGEKWETDKALRQGMRNIRSATEKALQSAHTSPGHSLSKQQAENLGEQIDQQVRHIFAECKLSAEADAVLHTLLADILSAAQQLTAGSASDTHSIQQTRVQALIDIQNSLNLYPEYFNDGEW